MKKTMILLAMVTGISQTALASGPEVTIEKSVQYIGKIVGKTKVATDRVCKLTINLAVFTNEDHPEGPIKFEYVDFRLATAGDLTSLNQVPVWQEAVIQRTNVEATDRYSNESALPMKSGEQGKSAYDGSTLYKKQKNGDAIYTGKTEIWINNVSPNPFASKPTEVQVLQKGGTFLPINTEADFTCQL